MLNILKNRFEQGYRTSSYPKKMVELVPRYRGRPQVHKNAPSDLVAKCAAACPQDAIDTEHARGSQRGVLSLLPEILDILLPRKTIC